jgi:hypothetical protein
MAVPRQSLHAARLHGAHCGQRKPEARLSGRPKNADNTARAGPNPTIPTFLVAGRAAIWTCAPPRRRRHQRPEACAVDPHRLELRARLAHQRAAWLEAEVPLQPLPARGGRHHDDVEIAREALAFEPLREPRQHHGAAPGRLDREQPDLADPRAGRKEGAQRRQLLVERERAPSAQHEHADQLLARQADQVAVLRMEAIGLAPLRIRCVLRDLLDEAAVVEAVDRLELGVAVGDLEDQRVIAAYSEANSAPATVWSPPAETVCGTRRHGPSDAGVRGLAPAQRRGDGPGARPGRSASGSS